MDLVEHAPSLVLRPLTSADEAEARLGHEELAHEELAHDRFTFLLGLRSAETWEDYVARLEAYRRGEAALLDRPGVTARAPAPSGTLSLIHI